jgi:hypothetical protein
VPITDQAIFRKKKKGKPITKFSLAEVIVVPERSNFSFELFDDPKKHRTPLRRDTNINQGFPRRRATRNHNQISVLKTGKFATKVCDEVNR